jgi:DNA helicase-2/ATP-dependent DNA helicase PcrA
MGLGVGAGRRSGQSQRDDRRVAAGRVVDLLEDLSLGKSWLSFARGSSAIDYEHGEYRKEKKKYMGKTYDSVDSIAEFFKQRNKQLGETPAKATGQSRPAPKPGPSTAGAAGQFVPGSYVKHSKYGRGLVLRREGAGESTKLTVSFPGYGQKKLVEKYAGLEKA